jgi:PAS domain S-box-containing protein
MKDQDKTKEQLIEELAELRRSEAQWRSVVVNTPLFVCLVDRAGTIQYLNRTVPGITMEDAIGKSTYDFVEPAHWEMVRECIERVFDTGQTASYESVSAGPNGSRSWYETSVGPVTVGDQVVAVTLIATDITQRKRAEEALCESEERFKAFMDNSPALAWMKDAQGRHVYVNAPHEKRFGRFADKQGKTDFELWPREIAEQFWKNDQAVLAGNTVMEVMEEIAVSDGGRTYWWNFKFPFQDASGKRYVGGVGVDITARKRAEEALQKAHDELEQEVEKRTAELAIFKKFAEASGLGFGMTGLDGRIAYVNSAWLRLVGESQVEDVIGQHISTFCPKDYWERRNTEVVPALLQKGLWQGEFALVSRDGRVIPAIHSLFPIRDKGGSLVQLGAVVTDITERKRAEEALRQSEERYELAVRGAGVGIWDWDIRTDNLYFSPRWKMLFGYGDTDIGNSVEDWARLLHPDERDWMLKFLEDFLGGTSPTVTVEYRLRHKDGSYRWIVATGLVVRDEQGKAYRFVGSHGDITDRKRAEEALERERQTLWHMLQASDYERRLIAYDIHDGLAQYLAAAGMQFQAHDALKENSPNKAKKAYETAVELVRQAHAESRRLISEVRPPVIDEDGLETAISHLVHEQRRHGGPKIECLSSVQFGRLPSILENALYRIAQEALANACKHSKSKKVTVTMTQEGQDVRLEVQDWGIGFDPESVEKDHFGLEGIRQRVRLLGGRLTIESTPGSGTLVQVVVPIVEKKEEE